MAQTELEAGWYFFPPVSLFCHLTPRQRLGKTRLLIGTADITRHCRFILQMFSVLFFEQITGFKYLVKLIRSLQNFFFPLYPCQSQVKRHTLISQFTGPVMSSQQAGYQIGQAQFALGKSILAVPNHHLVLDGTDNGKYKMVYW